MKLRYFICVLVLVHFSVEAQKKARLPEIGVVQNVENDSLLKAFGYLYLVESVNKLISPRSISEEQFQTNLQKIKKLDIPLYALNIFIPGELKVVGPEVNEDAVLKYVEGVFKRCNIAGVNRIIWGSGGSRRVPEGFDHKKATDQFVSIAKKIAALADKYKIILALENLNSTETNFITTVAEALDIVKKVDHKNLRLCVDVYHMLKENDGPASIEKTKGYVIYCEVAEKEGRTPPGVHGDDFTPYFAALRKIGYNGKIMIECRWDDVATQGPEAFKYLQKEIEEAYR
jgi:sugar phosphate isomerase/epimerase